MWISAVRYQQSIKILVRAVKSVGGGLTSRAVVCSDALIGRELEAVADAEVGQDVGRAGRGGFELLPQPADKDPQILDLFGLRPAPALAPAMAVGAGLARRPGG